VWIGGLGACCCVGLFDCVEGDGAWSRACIYHLHKEGESVQTRNRIVWRSKLYWELRMSEDISRVVPKEFQIDHAQLWCGRSVDNVGIQSCFDLISTVVARYPQAPQS
jgi:hypothetical protein